MSSSSRRRRIVHTVVVAGFAGLMAVGPYAGRAALAGGPCADRSPCPPYVGAVLPWERVSSCWEAVPYDVGDLC